jgi:hypothetical protein
MTPPDKVRSFVNLLLDSAEAIAIALTNKTDAETDTCLERTRANLTRDLTRELGAERAAALADGFVGRVRGGLSERRQLARMGLLNLSRNQLNY